MGRTETSLAYAHVDGDGEGAFRAATERLVALGHRRIGFVAAPAGFTFAKLRRRGWATAMQAAGLACDAAVENQLTEFGGLAAARELLARTPRPTALLCATDRMAIGAMRAVKEAGFVVGRDVSVIGHDNISAGAFTEPALSTMELSMVDVGTRVAEMLIALIGGADPRDHAEILPVIPIERASVAPPQG
jgi:LacI family transcriptional regulator